MYSIELGANGQVYKGKGKTLKEAIDSIDLKPLEVKTKGVLTVHKGTGKERKTVVKFFYLKQLRTLVGNPVRRGGFIMQIESLLDYA